MNHKASDGATSLALWFIQTPDAAVVLISSNPQ